MGSSENLGARVSRSRAFVVGVTVRAVLAGSLSYLAIWLVLSKHLYATALVVVIIITVVVADLTKIVSRSGRWLEDDLERLTAEVSDAPSAPFVSHVAGESPLERARNVLSAARTDRQRHLDYLQTLLDTVSASLIVVHDDGRVTLANRAARRFAGAAVDRLEQIAAIGSRVARNLLALRPGTRQIVPLADGRQVFVVVSEFSVPGRPAQRLVALQRIAGDLDAVELKAWQDMVQVLTHEMMNSLTPISSLSESLESLLRSDAGSRRVTGSAQSAVADDIAGALEAIKRRSLGLMGFVERYRTVAELPSPKRQMVRMDGLLSGIDRLIAPMLREKGVAYSTSISPPELCADADPQLLEQAVINLLRNAADAVVGVESPRIEVTCEARDGQVMLAVCDNGAGVPEDRRDQIFVPFFTTKPGGSGIGLNLARHIALGHGGQLDVRSHVPRGSVFTLSLPVTVPSG
jgi:two-component system, NtrC family, nitrogen regulation sensor histidine kinase NtrY